VDVTTIDGKLNMRVIRGLRDGELVYVFSTDQILARTARRVLTTDALVVKP
jgi:hypothetical protein